MKKVYLCGPINKCSDAEATDWREQAKTRLAGKFELVDPMRRDYRGKEHDNVWEIINGDKNDYRNCEIVLAYCPKPSVGTSMEVFDSYENRFQWLKPWTWLRKNELTIIVHPDDKPSPWLHHSHAIVKTFDEAFEVIRGSV